MTILRIALVIAIIQKGIGVKVLVAGNMGGGAYGQLNNVGIWAYRGSEIW